jgi:hypothetical protein
VRSVDSEAMVERRELHGGGRYEPSFIRGAVLSPGRKTSAREPLAEGARMAGNWTLAPLLYAALRPTWEGFAGLDADLGLSAFEE